MTEQTMSMTQDYVLLKALWKVQIRTLFMLLDRQTQEELLKTLHLLYSSSEKSGRRPDTSKAIVVDPLPSYPGGNSVIEIGPPDPREVDKGKDEDSILYLPQELPYRELFDTVYDGWCKSQNSLHETVFNAFLDGDF